MGQSIVHKLVSRLCCLVWRTCIWRIYVYRPSHEWHLVKIRETSHITLYEGSYKKFAESSDRPPRDCIRFVYMRLW